MIEELQRAISLLGSQSELAAKMKPYLPPGMKVGQSHITSWLNRDKKVPAEYCLPIEKATNGKIKRNRLRPDVFGEA